ncbi:helix-turn-helix transcriptional regulator [Phaeobacter sp. A90a-4f]|uniref:helix-turn-helix domain-containing protein n=1 Tax=Phaeobacter TaxID=302485 RepID=UPI0021A913DB|nr:helix-turn-helix transcriptional regulator [Phaeobacter inhibens]UWS05648.1 helix-turn-helix transcriptional regulator [Phaeobacter inhibens]
MSAEFDFDITPKDAAAAYFMERNHRLLLAAALKAKREKGISQRSIAELIGVNKSVISRALKGQNNLTERTIAEICWALGVEPTLTLQWLDKANGNNCKHHTDIPRNPNVNQSSNMSSVAANTFKTVQKSELTANNGTSS